MPTFTTFICDEHDTEYTLEVDYNLLEADPDAGLTSQGAEITSVRCEEIKAHTAGDSHIIFPPSDLSGLGESSLSEREEWLGKWCWEKFEDAIMEKAATAACQYEPDILDHEP